MIICVPKLARTTLVHALHKRRRSQPVSLILRCNGSEHPQVPVNMPAMAELRSEQPPKFQQLSPMEHRKAADVATPRLELDSNAAVRPVAQHWFRLQLFHEGGVCLQSIAQDPLSPQ